MTTYLGEKAVGVGTVKATMSVGKVITDNKTISGDGFTEPLAVNTLLFATSESVAASANAVRTEFDGKLKVVDSAIDGQAKAIAKTRNDFEVADQEIRADMSETSSELQTQITSQENEIAKLKQEVAGLSSLSLEIVNELPAVGKGGVIYLVPSGGEAPNLRDEYVWVNGAFEVIGSTQVDLTGYVKNTDYATGDVGGVFKRSTAYGLTMLNGHLVAGTDTLAQYQTRLNYFFIGKGTLENIKKDIVERAVSEDGAVLSGYVKDTDYATNTKAGVVKAETRIGVTTLTDGSIYPINANLATYTERSGNFFVGKGTLENIKNDLVKRAITTNDITLTDQEKTAAQAWLGVDGGDCGLIIRRL
jgi:hypothetical protein